MSSLTRRCLALGIVSLVSAVCLQAQVPRPSPAVQGTVPAAACNQDFQPPSLHVSLPGSPFGVVPTRDGCWVFVSLAISESADGPGIAVLKRDGASLSLERIVPVDGVPLGMTLTQDEQLLVVAGRPRVMFLDVRRLTSGNGDPVLGYWTDGNPQAG